MFKNSVNSVVPIIKRNFLGRNSMRKTESKLGQLFYVEELEDFIESN